MKTCIRCKEKKRLEEFYLDKRLRSGRMACCKLCVQKRSKEYKTPELQRKYNQTARLKIKNNPTKYAKLLKYQRDLYKRKGRNKFPNTCIVCNKTFLSVRKDRKFCSPKCISTGKNNGRWLGGRQKHSSGYILIYSPHHPYAKNNFVFEHRLVMEKYLNRFLLPTEVIHHINGIRDDNRLENLMLFKNSKEHIKFHFKLRKKNANN